MWLLIYVTSCKLFIRLDLYLESFDLKICSNEIGHQSSIIKLVKVIHAGKNSDLILSTTTAYCIVVVATIHHDLG